MELVKCITNDLEVPCDVDFVIEGYVDPSEDLICEGPFGDHTGYYSLQDYYPKFHVTCITHRMDAVYPATIVGIPPQEDAYIGKATERIFLTPIRMAMLPEIIDMDMPAEGVFHNIVIVKINKEYQGHANKVMNALWGAGQMMFNKVLIVVDGNVDIHNYSEVFKAIIDNTNPNEDVYFANGPVDVLDHSSKRFALGSKLGVDATCKSKEESFIISNKIITPFINKEKIKETYPEVKDIRDFNDVNLPLAIITVKKDRKHHIRELATSLTEEGLLTNFAFVLFMDDNIPLCDVKDVIWMAANNIDPERDCSYINDKDGEKHYGLIIDGTRKTKKYDDFKRDWPNIVVVDDKTIESIDRKWDKLGLGEFIPSPSLKYKALLFKGDAVAEEE